ncbi:hypothetical protein ACQPZ2_24545 [Nocardia pseudovaccinii]|uniref:hypothetical protein n=1 Tax=Nocardia pseudovaccinii TaxID=189540 RepID=UPI003D8A3AE2
MMSRSKVALVAGLMATGVQVSGIIVLGHTGEAGRAVTVIAGRADQVNVTTDAASDRATPSDFVPVGRYQSAPPVWTEPTTPHVPNKAR